ncbi:MAG TPA: hypothetical protein VGO68_02655, partial [Pyrinomonadaceae bacterium]|nr:hypothetical protein [Pyrinomonadaceae bacterium]
GPRASRPHELHCQSILELSDYSRCALIAGGTPAVPANHLSGSSCRRYFPVYTFFRNRFRNSDNQPATLLHHTAAI